MIKSLMEHILVLMMENRSDDHMRGYLPVGHGLTGEEYNYVDPANPKSEKVYVSKDSDYVNLPKPAHDVVSVEKQEYGDISKIVTPAPMSGFIRVQIETAKGDIELGNKIMQFFDPVKNPALATPAREFELSDQWHTLVLSATAMPGNLGFSSSIGCKHITPAFLWVLSVIRGNI